MEKIAKMIKELGLKISDLDYHTIRTFENGGRIRAMVIKGQKIAHIEYKCPNCGYEGYKTQEWKAVSKGAKYRFSTKCDKCGFVIKVEKLKGGKRG